MEIRRLLLATLAGLPATACPSTWNCHPDEQAVDLRDHPVTAAELAHLGLAPGQTPSAEDCEQACERAWNDETGWYVTEVDACVLVVDGYGSESAEDEVVGALTCEGRAIEYYCEGRRPLGHVEAEGRGPDALGRTLASLAHLEAASVHAFDELAAWLEARQAPASLVARCRAAAADEVRHARWLGALAERRGAVVPTPCPQPVDADLEQVALQNAVEGCVHETWAALEAALAATRAADPALRTLWARIASDEAEHAQLAWDLHAWLLERLEPAARQRVRDRQAAALASLPRRAASSARRAPVAVGFPAPELAQRLAGDLAARLAA